jgi:fumarylacetoacetase
MNIPANDPALRSWVDVPANSDFPIQNLPFGVGSKDGEDYSAYSRIGDLAIDLYALWEMELIPAVAEQDGTEYIDRLNGLLLEGPEPVRALRQRLSELLRHDVHPAVRDKMRQAMVPVQELIMDVPVHIGDYTDFYSSRQHAYNVGAMFRDPANALLPNWLHLPVGYHGRASSIVVSGTPIRRPKGQYKPSPDEAPVFGPSRQLDMELEVGFITYDGNELGERIYTA